MKLKGKNLEQKIDELIRIREGSFYEELSSYHRIGLFDKWLTLVESIDEYINIPFYIDANHKDEFLSLNINMSSNEGKEQFLKKVYEAMGGIKNENTKRRFISTSIAFSSLDYSLEKVKGIRFYKTIGGVIQYLQSNRLIFRAILALIPSKCKGDKQIEFNDLFLTFVPLIENHLQPIKRMLQAKIVNKCLDDYEAVIENGLIIEENYKLKNLEDFSMKPERQSLLDRFLYREEEVKSISTKLDNSQGLVFSANEFRNSVKILSEAYEVYGLSKIPEYRSYSVLLGIFSKFVERDYHIKFRKKELLNFLSKINAAVNQHEMASNLIDNSKKFSQAVSSVAPFVIIDDIAFSNVNYLLRFLYHKKNEALEKQKKYQINSGFVFEDVVKTLCEKHGFIPQEIKRINRKEFDVVTLKGETIFNFQCKNNVFEYDDYPTKIDLIAKRNKYIVKSLLEALEKERKREHLLKEKLSLSDIKHYVVSRYPVITRKEEIIQYNELEDRLIEINKEYCG